MLYKQRISNPVQNFEKKKCTELNEMLEVLCNDMNDKNVM
jgi:hypothetical protein